MKLRTSILALPLVVLAAGCGNGAPRVLQSVTASPASADAKNFPNGQVHFIPTDAVTAKGVTVVGGLLGALASDARRKLA